jgi:hypothetical protein
MTDPRDQRLAAILRNAWPQPRPGWEARTLAAMAAVRPRRHPNLVKIIVIAALILLLAASAYAAARLLLEAKLQFSHVTGPPAGEDPETRVLTGQTVGQDLEWGAPGKPLVQRRGGSDLSPDGKQRVFHRGNATIGFGMHECDVYLAGADGSHERNVSQAAGLGGINCDPMWSPDGTMIRFAHTDPVEGKTPCQAHFEPWAMRADGSGAHRLTPKGSPGIFPAFVGWSRDSSRLYSCWQTDVCDNDSQVVAAFTVEVRTGRIQVLPNVGNLPCYSPDEKLIASMRCEPDTVKGERGFWNQLLLTNADGSDPRVLVQQFISAAAIRGNPQVRDDVLRHGEGYDWVNEARMYAGPWPAAWSPKGNQLAFLAALPYDPKGPTINQQIEVWVYDLRSKQTIRITHDNIQQTGVRWK